MEHKAGQFKNKICKKKSVVKMRILGQMHVKLGNIELEINAFGAFRVATMDDKR